MSERFDKWVMLAIGLVGGWLIATFPGWVDAWGKEHWWNIATAVGTISAAVAAVWVAIYSKNQEKIRRKVEAIVYIWEIFPYLARLEDFFNDALYALDGGSLEKKSFQVDTKTRLDRIEVLRFSLIYELHPKVCTNFIQMRNALQSLDHMFTQGHWHPGVVNTTLLHLRRLAGESCRLIKDNNVDKYMR